MELFKNRIKAKEVTLTKQLNVIENISQFVDSILFLDIAIVVSILMQMTDADSKPFMVDNTEDIDFIKAYETWMSDGTFRKAKRVIGYRNYKFMDTMVRARYAELSNSFTKMMPNEDELELLSKVAKEGGVIG